MFSSNGKSSFNFILFKICAVEDHTERKKTLLSKDLGKVGLNQFFLRNLNPLFLKCLILEMSNIFDFADMS